MLMKKLWEKGENTGNQHFLLFLQCFLLYLGKFCHFGPPLMLSANALN